MQETDKTQGQAVPYRDTCGKCGAKRIDQQIGLEDTPDAYVARLVEVFREVRRVLHPSGTVWLNLGDSYAGSARCLMGDGTPSDRGDAKQGTNRGTTIGTFGKPDWGVKSKDLLGIPWACAFALRADGWWLRSAITWCKGNPMPESVLDRPTSATEQIFLLAKSSSYFYDADAIREPYNQGSLSRYKYQFGNGSAAAIAKSPAVGNGNGHDADPNPMGRNRRNWWVVNSQPYAGAHFAVMPTKLVEPCVLAGSSAHGCCSKCHAPWERVVEHRAGDAEAFARPKHLQSSKSTLSLSGNGSKEWAERGGKSTTLGWQPTCTCAAPVMPCTVIDPFCGSGTTGFVALRHHRRFIGIDLNADYLELARRRIEQTQPMLFEVLP